MVKSSVNVAVIVAAGSSQRMGSVDKIFALLAGKSVLLNVLQPFLYSPLIDRIVVVLGSHNFEKGQKLIAAQKTAKKVTVCIGGKRRQDSVLNGLKQAGECDFVVIQDGARPLITKKLIEDGLEAAKETGAAIAAVPVIDTIKVAGKAMIATDTLARENLWQVQTPQVFRLDVLLKAYREVSQDVTDDARLVELNGGKVKLYLGSYDNIKITTPADLAVAEMLITRRRIP